MLKTHNTSSRGVVAVQGFLPRNFLPALAWCGALLLLLTWLPVSASENDDRYFKIYGVIEQGDAAAKAGQVEKAKTKYIEAEKSLKELKQVYPTYNPKLVAARLNYLAEKIATLSKPPVVEEVVAPESKPAGVKATIPGQPQVKLLEAGAEPRKVFRIQTKAGDVQKATMTVKVSMGMNMPDMPSSPIKMPAMKLKMVTTTKNVSAEGDINYEMLLEDVEVVSDASVMPQVVEALKESLKGVKGLVVAGTMTERGFSKKVEAKIPAGADAHSRESLEQMKQTFANTAFLLPEEAIGVGAKWEVKDKLKTQGMTIDQAAKHELISVEGEVLTTKSAVTQSAANQKIASPMMPTMKVDMTKMTGTATGITTFDVAKIMPTKIATDDQSEINMAMNAGGKKQTMTMKTDTNISLESE